MSALKRRSDLEQITRALALLTRSRSHGAPAGRTLELVPVQPFSWRRETRKLELALGQLARTSAEPNNILAR